MSLVLVLTIITTAVASAHAREAVAAAVEVEVAGESDSTANVFNIIDYGAVAGDTSSEAGYTNGKAFNAALMAANASAGGGNGRPTVLVPAGADFTYIPDATTDMTGLAGITVQIDGDITAFQQPENMTRENAVWPYDASQGKYHDFFLWSDCFDVRVMGSGKIDGHGYEWWWASVLKRIDDASRPHIFVVNGCRNLYFGGYSNAYESALKLKNSPEYHMILTDIDTLTCEYIDIRVDVDIQRALLESVGLWHTEFNLPMFPLNTDGIDPAGSNVWIHHVNISNFDDAVAVKPCNGQFRYSTCSQDMLIEDAHVTWGLGMTIGSVPPHVAVNCVRNILFRRIEFTFPIKAVYVKTNPGTVGSGIIQNITYLDMTATDAVWWAIYIGPQQQKQPDGDGAGCMLYPINPDCPTNPLVPMSDITIRNFRIDGTLFSPAIVRCNATAPCTGFVFDQINITRYDRFPFGDAGYKIENVYGTASNCEPTPVFDGVVPPAPKAGTAAIDESFFYSEDSYSDDESL